MEHGLDSAGGIRTDVALDDKYTARSGPVFISGIQALVRLMLEQRRLDDERGLDTGLFVSGYQGSPLGGLDGELKRAAVHADPLGVVFTPGLNEELAATAVAGTQLIGEVDGRLHDGVTGFWFGKNPGLDRAADAIRHATVSGTSPLGGAVALIGDDPSCKSSTIPSSCEPMCRSLLMPLLAPGTVAELIEFGLHAVALSRASGLWSGLKIVADLADASAVVEVGDLAVAVPAPRVREFHPPVLLPPMVLEAEHDLLGPRLERVGEYAREVGLNRVEHEPRGPVRTALVAAGNDYQMLLRALAELGLDAEARDAAGLRLVKIGMPWPLDRETALAIADGAAEVVVFEDKLPFIESQLKELLYGEPSAPPVLGKRGADGRPLLSAAGALSVESITAALASLPGLAESVRERAGEIAAHARTSAELPLLPARTPYFCSGCPHNLSTKASDEQLVGVGIGCHTMVVLDRDGRGNLLGLTQMGGEGAQWLGLGPFCEEEHFVQNVGDGTFHHSASLAVRAAVAGGAHITYKLLYNDAVAMTGGQRIQGRLDVPRLTAWLAAEGVERVIVIAAEPSNYAGIKLDPVAEVRDRRRLAESEADLAAVDGVTVLVYDDRCATEERRMRKRGKLEAPAERVWINERVCEGCGDCGDVSTCLSVLPIETDLGRKTRIHQSSCNQDFACLDGDCPSFLLVKPGKAADRVIPEPPSYGFRDPVGRVPADALVRMPGIGGTGVVTISQILQMAAHLDGNPAAGLEQIGLAQKGGPVVSDVRFGPASRSGSLRASAGAVDVLLGLDLLGASTAATLQVLDPGRTVAIVNTAVVPTAEMVTDVKAGPVPQRRARRRIEAATRAEEGVFFDAQELSVRLFGDHVLTNMIVVGAAFQHGCIPVSAAAIERAIELNGTAVEKNLAAFAWGRAVLADPGAVERATAEPDPPEPPAAGEAREIVAATGVEGELREMLEFRVADLIGYQNRALAERYATRAVEVRELATRRVGDAGEGIAQTYAWNAHRLLAYKDEYEVARLHLDVRENARREEELGSGAKVKVLLHPPVLRSLGVDRKLEFGPWIFPFFKLLRVGRRLRGHWFDPFGHAEVRRVERALIGEYEEIVDRALALLEEDNADAVRELLSVPGEIRGYEEIKLRNVDSFRARTTALFANLEEQPAIS